MRSPSTFYTISSLFHDRCDLLFWDTVAALLLLAPNIDLLSFGISFYALTRYGFIINAAITLVGTAGILLAIVLWPTRPPGAGRIELALQFAWGLTSILAGASPSTLPHLSGFIHNLAGFNLLVNRTRTAAH